jgi:hypothetical protein
MFIKKTRSGLGRERAVNLDSFGRNRYRADGQSALFSVTLQLRKRFPNFFSACDKLIAGREYERRFG